MLESGAECGKAGSGEGTQNMDQYTPDGYLGKHLFFIGIGGVSMSSLALIARRAGAVVAGSDAQPGESCARLREAGISVYAGHDAAHLQGAERVIYTAAVHAGNPELDAARAQGIPCISRAAFLGELMRLYGTRIGVAGTHGKSTTTSMIAAVLMEADADPTVLSGAVLPAMGGAYRLGGRETFVFEACEYQDSFLSSSPTVTLTLNAEMEHVDYFHSKEQMIDSFRRWMRLGQTAVVGVDSEWVREAAAEYPGRRITFGLCSEQADWSAAEISYEDGCGRFLLTKQGSPVCRVALSVPGRHCIYDAVAALAVCLDCCGISPEIAAEALRKFTGASRRFEPKGLAACGAAIFDDYAHHPTEIAATLEAALCGNGKLWCVFQPHTYSRTAELFPRFREVFLRAAQNGVSLIFTDIYSAGRESNTYGVTAEQLAREIPGARYMPKGEDFSGIADFLNREAKPGERILVMGAGDVTALCGRLKKTSV